jgi:hypothetical protein
MAQIGVVSLRFYLLNKLIKETTIANISTIEYFKPVFHYRKWWTQEKSILDSINLNVK